MTKEFKIERKCEEFLNAFASFHFQEVLNREGAKPW
jgi:hypothetical protein